MANRYGDIDLPFTHNGVINTTYKYSVPNSAKTHRINLSWLVTVEKAGESISIEDFATALNETVLDRGFLQLMGNEVRVGWLVIEPNTNSKAPPSTQHSIALSGKYGHQLERIDPLRGFHFTMHHSSSLKPTNLYLRGVPKSFDVWDKDDTMHQAVESCCEMLITDLSLGPLSLRQVLPQTNSYKLDFIAPDAVNRHGTRLFSGGRKPEAAQKNGTGKKKVSTKPVTAKKPISRK